MRHKITVLFLVLTLLLNLAACGNSSSTLTDAGTTDIETDTSDSTDESTATDAGTTSQEEHSSDEMPVSAAPDTGTDTSDNTDEPTATDAGTTSQGEHSSNEMPTSVAPDMGTDTSGNTDKPTTATGILIAYFSRAGENYNVGVIEKGNTEIVAEMIAEQTGGDLFHIETVDSYPENYQECTNVAQQEQRDNARPELSATVANMDGYDTIYLGYPIWWGDMPMAVYTFLESYDFAGKTIIPFCTHAGSGLAGTVRSITSACPGASVESGLAVSGTTAQNDRESTKNAVIQWLEK
jgi:flavodoxin